MPTGPGESTSAPLAERLTPRLFPRARRHGPLCALCRLASHSRPLPLVREDGRFCLARLLRPSFEAARAALSTSRRCSSRKPCIAWLPLCAVGFGPEQPRAASRGLAAIVLPRARGGLTNTRVVGGRSGRHAASCRAHVALIGHVSCSLDSAAIVVQHAMLVSSGRACDSQALAPSMKFATLRGHNHTRLRHWQDHVLLTLVAEASGCGAASARRGSKHAARRQAWRRHGKFWTRRWCGRQWPRGCMTCGREPARHAGVPIVLGALAVAKTKRDARRYCHQRVGNRWRTYFCFRISRVLRQTFPDHHELHERAPSWSNAIPRRPEAGICAARRGGADARRRSMLLARRAVGAVGAVCRPLDRAARALRKGVHLCMDMS